MYKSVAFDLDGTLIDTSLKQTILMSAICLSCETPFDENRYWKLKRSGFTNIDALVEMGISLERSRWISKMWKLQIETNYWLGFDKVIKGSKELLEQLREQETSIFLITARSNQVLLRLQLHRLGLDKYFEGVHIVNPENVVVEKSNALQSTGVEIFVGDSELDSQAARSANIPFKGVDSGQRSSEFLQHNGVHSISSNARLALELNADC